jgi:short-subunit dehydrogenase
MNIRAVHPTALITGASSGIGFEFAGILARKQYNVVLVARDEERLRSAEKTLAAEYDVRCLAIPADLSRRESVEHIVKIIDAEKISIDLLINNAGFGTSGRFSLSDLNEEQKEIDVNISSLVRLTKHLLPGMIEKKHGMILNVASTAGFVPGPFMAVYYATKAFVISFSESLSEELRGTGVTISVLCPGPTLTGFQKRAGIDRINLTRRIFTMGASSVAELGLRGLMRGKVVIVPGIRNKLVVFMIRSQPRRFVRSVAGILNSPR